MGPDNGIQMHEQVLKRQPKSMQNHLKWSQRRGGVQGDPWEAKGHHFERHSETSLASKYKKNTRTGIPKSNPEKAWTSEVKAIPKGCRKE